MNEIIYTFLFSLSPFGEARVGIPYGIISGLNPVTALMIGLVGNLFVFPLFALLIQQFNKKLWRFHAYRKQSIKLLRRAKRFAGTTISKYGFWGLMIFVMIPAPVTGAYMGTIAAILFDIKRKHAFAAISIGVTISCVIVATGTHFSMLGIQIF
jgi:uncharacterized membrane protein